MVKTLSYQDFVINCWPNSTTTKLKLDEQTTTITNLTIFKIPSLAL